MEMCYDGTLVMPANYAVVSEDEMTYVDGGFYKCDQFCYNSALEAYDELNKSAMIAYGFGFGVAIGAIVFGTALGMKGGVAGAKVGAIIGAIGGILGGSLIWSFANALDNGALQAKHLSGPCIVTAELQNCVLSITVTSGCLDGSHDGRGGGSRRI